jgi:Uma2 family endonuclease
MVSLPPYVVDPADPRAPPQELWARLRPEERARIIDSLPSEYPSTAPPEGDFHRIPKERALGALGEYFRRINRRVYASSELPVYYPDEPRFAPDILAVLDVEPDPRDRWVVSAEGKGLDFVLEVALRGDAKKDLVANVQRYARLGIPEYFAYEPLKPKLSGFRLERAGVYTPIVPQGGLWHSGILGLGLGMESGRIRFFAGTGPLPDVDELIAKLGRMLDDVVAREQQLLDDFERERQRAEREHTRAERLAEKLRQLGKDPDAD